MFAVQAKRNAKRHKDQVLPSSSSSSQLKSLPTARQRKIISLKTSIQNNQQLVESINQSTSVLVDDLKKEERLETASLNVEEGAENPINTLWTCYIEHVAGLWLKREVDDAFFEEWWKEFSSDFDTLRGANDKENARKNKWDTHYDVLRFLTSRKITNWDGLLIGWLNRYIVYSDKSTIRFNGVIPSVGDYNNRVLVWHI